MDDGFTYVERKKLPKKQRKGKQPMQLSLVERIEQRRGQRKAFAGTCADRFDQVLRQVDPPRVAACYALGSLSGLPGSSNSLEQLVLLETLLDRLELSSVVDFCDPAFTGDDVEYIHSRGWRVHEPRHFTAVEHTAFYYLPHCPRGVFEDLLRSNWSAQGLARLVLLGNRLPSYVDREARQSKRDRFPCICRIAPHLAIEELPPMPDDVDADAFNDIAFQWISPRSLARLQLDDEFWLLPTPVDHAQSDDDA